MADSSTNDSYETYDLWDRVGCVEIDFGDGTDPIRFNGLDFKFNVTKVAGNYPEGDVDVRILGLSKETANRIITICNMQEALLKKKRVRVYAGYRGMSNGSNYIGEKIIDADISYAKVDTPPPEMWVSIVGIIGYRYRMQQISISYPPSDSVETKEKSDGVARYEITEKTITKTKYLAPTFYSITGGQTSQGSTVSVKEKKPIKYKELCEEVVKILNTESEVQQNGMKVKLDFRASCQNKEIESFNASGNLCEVVIQLQEMADVFIFFDSCSDNDTELLVVIDRPRNEKNDLNTNKSIIRHKKLNKSTGLVGIPSVANAVSLNCTCLLDPRLTVGDYVDLESEVMPQASGSDWQITKLVHKGHLRGTEWYTTIEAQDYKRLAQSDKSIRQMQQKLDSRRNALKS